MGEPINFTTGPVKIEEDVVRIFNSEPVSHRTPQFRNVLEEVRKKLCKATKAKDVIIMSGSGTLANEAMIAQIANLGKHGVILTNGEFGDRLIKQCCRYKMNFSIYKKEWGEHFNFIELRNYIQKHKPAWILFCHHETSTGVINNLSAITTICSENDTKVYVDCISSIGNIEVDLSRVALATSSSGKGIASFPGLAIVFVNIPLSNSSYIPSYLDLKNYIELGYIPFTLNSNLLFALNIAIGKTMNRDHWREIEKLSHYLKNQFNDSGWAVLNKNQVENEFVFSLILRNQGSIEFGDSLKEEGILVSYESNYLKNNNMIQIALMGKHQPKEIQYCIEKMIAVRNIAGVPIITD